MTNTTQAHAHDEDQPLGRGGAWRRRWQKMKTPAQVIAGQLIGWALRTWLG
jgi:hypothetical protein